MLFTNLSIRLPLRQGRALLALTPRDILDTGGLHAQIRVQSQRLLSMFAQQPRLSALFATQQRWLMSHIVLAMHFNLIAAGRPPGFGKTQALDAVHGSGVASRNTAEACLNELIHYSFVQQTADPADRRRQRLIIAPVALDAISGWLQIHFATLDAMAGGERLNIYLRSPDMIAHIQPAIAKGLLASRAVRVPAGTFSLFTWLDNGGAVMDWLIAAMPDMPAEAERVPVGAVDITDMAAMFGLSRTHLSRKLKQAEDLGSMGWDGRRGRSGLWVSRTFRREYDEAQAVKLSIIDHAFAALATHKDLATLPFPAEISPEKVKHA